MFRKISILLGAGLFSILLSLQAPVMARDLTAGAEKPDQTFWLTIKDTTLPDLFEMFIKRYPQSPHRVAAEQKLKNLRSSNQLSAIEQAQLLTRKTPNRVSASRSVAGVPSGGTRAPALAAPVLAAVVAPMPVKVPVSAPLPVTSSQLAGMPSQAQLSTTAADEDVIDEVSHDTIILIQYNLNRVGCNVGKLDGKWGPKSQSSAARFARITRQPLVSVLPTIDLLNVLKGYEEETCAPVYQAKPRIKKIKRARRSPTIRRIKKSRTVKHRKKIRKKKVAKKKTVKKKVAKKASKRKKVKTANNVLRKKKKKAHREDVNVPLILLQSGLAFGGGRRPGRGGSNGGGGQFSIQKSGGSANRFKKN